MATTFEIRSKVDGSLAGTADTMTAADRLLLHLQRTYLEPYWIRQVTAHCSITDGPTHYTNQCDCGQK